MNQTKIEFCLVLLSKHDLVSDNRFSLAMFKTAAHWERH